MSFYVKLRDSESYTLIEFQGSVDCALPKLSGLRLGLLDFKVSRFFIIFSFYYYFLNLFIKTYVYK